MLLLFSPLVLYLSNITSLHPPLFPISSFPQFFFGLFFFIVARYDSFLAKTVVRLSTRLCRRLHCARVRLHYFRLYLCFLASCTCLFLPVCVFRYTFCLVMYRVNSVVMQFPVVHLCVESHQTLVAILVFIPQVVLSCSIKTNLSRCCFLTFSLDVLSFTDNEHKRGTPDKGTTPVASYTRKPEVCSRAN